jgi:hypothetical protein
VSREHIAALPTEEVSVIGMLLYRYALAAGRFALFLDIEDIDAAVLRTLTEWFTKIQSRTASNGSLSGIFCLS